MTPLLAPIIGSVIDLIGKAIPDPEAKARAQLEVLKMQQSGDLAALDAELRLALAQIDVNKVEAAQSGLFKGGGRPAALWVCVLALGYSFLLRPLLPWFLTVAGLQGVPPLPAIDGEELFALLTGLLGLSTIRSVERLRGKA